MPRPNLSPIVIIGEPRSGTTWLGKIFDSHPDVFYLHEPDTVLQSAALPAVCRCDETVAYVPVARDYLYRLQMMRTLKPVGSMPFFAKSYRRMPSAILRNIAIAGMRALEQLDRSGRVGRLAMPDLLDPGRADRLRMVIKSIKSCGRAGVLAAAMEGGHIAFLVRHPCGQIASSLRGFKAGQFHFATYSMHDPTEDLVNDILSAERAVEHDLHRARLKAMPIVELLAWHWALLNQKVLDDLAGDARLQVLSYEGLCGQPLETSRRLFDAVGLDWHACTAAFLRRSTTYRGPMRYYGVMRNATAVVERWRHELDAVDQSRIIEIAGRFPVGHLALGGSQ
jgi:sulfotransferase family protein